MKIIYLTTSLHENDFDTFVERAEQRANPSGQNFHAKLIKVLRLQNEVEVVSALPFDSEMRLTDHDGYHYVPYIDSRSYNLFQRPKDIVKEAMPLFPGEKPIIIYDSLSRSLSKASRILANKRSLQRIAILTDNPKNLANRNYFVNKALFCNTAGADGAIALNDSLLKVFGLEKKPHAEILGIAEKMPISPFKPNYIYFGGALYERYGIMDLINAFLESKAHYDLIIAGHGPLANQIQAIAKDSPRIRFLGQISKEMNYEYESGAAMLVNPRRTDEKLDAESVPSKMIEYLASGRPILSTPNPYFASSFALDVNFLQESGEEAIQKFFDNHLNENGNFREILFNNSKDMVEHLFGFNAVSEVLQSFLIKLNCPSN
jgi:glycosyltransferase involved in cell wall biosynthesis